MDAFLVVELADVMHFLRHTAKNPTHRPGRWVVVLLFMLLAMAMVSPAWGQNNPQSCTRVDVATPPTIVSAAAWMGSKQAFVLLDSYEGLHYTMDLGGAVVPFDGDETSSLIFIENAGSDFLAISRSAEQAVGLTWLDSRLSPRRTLELGSSGSRGAGAFGLIPYEQELAAETLFAFGYQPDEKITGFYTVSAASGPRPEPDLVLEYEQDYYLLGLNLVASIGPDVYFLAMRPGDSPQLHTLDTRSGAGSLWSVDGWPKTKIPLPDFEMSFNQISDMVQVFDAVEAFEDVPVGLFSRGTDLYVLTRKIDGAGTMWSMTKLRPRNGSSSITVDDLGTVVLPTRSHHLQVVQIPGNRWAFLELGPVGYTKADGRDLLRQELSSFITVPGPWITDPATSPLREGASPDLCN